MLERQGGDYCRVLGIRFSSRSDLRAVDENLRDPAIVEPADAAGVGLIATFKSVKPMGSPVLSSKRHTASHSRTADPTDFSDLTVTINPTPAPSAGLTMA